MKTALPKWASAAALAVALVLGCASTDVQVEMETADVIYISPANQDGIQDAVSLASAVTTPEKLVIKRYRVEVRDQAGSPVLTREESAPKGGLLRSLALNHVYHHRGQLSVYLRLLNVPVPSIYGPSADEAPNRG